jgi:hypothetical protein
MTIHLRHESVANTVSLPDRDARKAEGSPLKIGLGGFRFLILVLYVVRSGTQLACNFLSFFL